MKIKSLLSFVFLVAALLCGVSAAPSASAATITVAWDHPNPADVKEFRVYEQVGTNWTLVKATTGAPAPLLLALENVVPGVHKYRVTAVNDKWGETAPSNTAATPAHDAPTNFRVLVEITVAVKT